MGFDFSCERFRVEFSWKYLVGFCIHVHSFYFSYTQMFATIKLTF